MLLGPEVGEHGEHDLGGGEFVPPEKSRGEGRHQAIPLHDIAPAVHEQHPVPVAVERDAEVSPLGGDGCGYGIHRRGAGSVDLRPVRLRAEEDEVSPQGSEEHRRNPRRRPMGAVEDDL
ncbi:MAG: hypothetical protein PHZ19_10345, partial [Candidatus Thermoplasmatota archaeon]|nr:hypothetical protein [Candidatus Thermoplasmatota archaeon]